MSQLWLISAKTFILAGASVKKNVKWHKKGKEKSVNVSQGKHMVGKVTAYLVQCSVGTKKGVLMVA